jgi:two-component system, chemotaxis family, protein-glutamate methylesterase/glutaminase
MKESRLPYFVAVGASGSEDFHDIQDLLLELPRPIFAVVMVVLHRPSEGVSHLRDALSRRSPMPVIVAEEAEVLEPGICYIGEPDGHLTLMDRDLAHLVPGANNILRNRTIDTLFNSLALYAPGRVIAVVLSGSLDDGSRGLAAIHKSRGLTMVLDPGGKPRGMQQNAIDYDGPISFIGTGKEIAQVIGRVIAEDAQPLRRSTT